MSLFDEADPEDIGETKIRSTACHCDCHTKGAIAEKWTIELYKGDAMVFRENKNNKYNISKIHWLLLIPYALLRNFSRIGNLIFLLISLAMLIDPDNSPYFQWITIFPLAVYSTLYVLKVLYLDLIKRRACRHMNKMKTRRSKLEGGGMDDEVLWEDLKPGDIIYLRKGEICPADIILLDTNLQKNKGMICWVDTQNVDGFVSYTMKRAVNATRVEKGSGRKDNYKEYRKILSGKIEYEAPHSNLNKFSGYIKLKKDPRPEHLSVENLVLRGSVIKNTDWIFGLCVYTGHDTKILMNSSYSKEKKSDFERLAERFFLFGTFLGIIMSLISMVVFLADRSQIEALALYPEDTRARKLLYYFILYSPSLPLAFYGTFDLILLWRRASLQTRIRKIGKKIVESAKESAVVVLDPNPLPNLGQVDYCFLDKTGTLTTGDYKIRNVYINSKLYNISSEVIASRIAEFRGKSQSQSKEPSGHFFNTQYTVSGVADFSLHKPTEAPLQASFHNLMELDVADDPEFETSPDIFNSYKFKEEIDNKTKQAQRTDKGDVSSSNVEISHIPLLGKSKVGEDLFSPSSSNLLEKKKFFGTDTLPESDAKMRTSGDNFFSKGFLNTTSKPPLGSSELKSFPKVTATQSVELAINQKLEEQGQGRFIVQRIESESPYFHDREKRVSFNIPGGRSINAVDQKEPQEIQYGDNDYLIDYFTLGDKNLEEFMRSLSLCHSARSRYYGDEYTYETSYPDELALLKFARLLGKMFVVSNRQDNPSEYTIKEEGNAAKYKILGVNDFSYSRKRFSIVYRSSTDDIPIICAKGPANNMKQTFALDQNELEAYDKIVTSFQERGYKAVAIGRRELKDDEASDFYKRYQNYKMSLYNQNEDLEILAREVEKSLKLVGIIALEDELKPEAKDTIKMLNDADIKTWMVTGDNQENAISTAYVTGLTTKKIELHTINLDKVEDAKAFIRNILNIIKKNHIGETSFAVNQDTSKIGSDSKMGIPINKIKSTVISKTVFDSSYKFAISIDGDSLELIFRDPYLKANFTFICTLCHTFIGYRFSPKHKKMVLSMVKKRFQNKPITMAIGDGLNDALMLRCADIGIEVKGSKGLLPSNAGDIQLASLGLLKEVMLIDGRNIAEKIEKTIHFAFYKSIVLGAPIFFFSFFNAFTGTPLYDPLLVFLYSFLLTFFPMLVYGGHDLSEPEQILLKFPALYIDGKKKKENFWKTYLIQSLLEGIIHAAIIFFGTTQAMSDALSQKGFTADLNGSSLVQYYSIIIITNMKLYWLFKRKKIWSFVLTLISAISLLIYLFINDSAYFVSIDYLQESEAIFSRGAPFLIILLIIGVSTTLSYLIRHYVIEKFYLSLYDWCAEINAGENIDEITNEMITSTVAKPKDLGAIVKNVYKQPELMDTIVQEMLSPADQNANQLGLRKYHLTFLDRRMEKQYRLVTSREALKYSRIAYLVGLVFFGGYSLGQSLILKDDVYTYSRMGVFLGFALFIFVLYTEVYRTKYFSVTFLYIFALYVTKGVFDWTGEEDSVFGAALLPLASQIIFKVSALWLAILNALYCVFFVIRIIIRYCADDSFEEFDQSTILGAYSALSFSFLIVGVFTLLSFLGHNFEKDLRNEHSANAKLEIQMNKSNDILSILLPKFVKEKIGKIGGGRSLAEDQGEVTILFCDIIDFDKVIQKEGKKVVHLLDSIFRTFDQFCGAHGIQKIETVGKTYMACAGLKSCEVGVAKKILSINPTRRILNLALDMDEYSKKMTYGDGAVMRLRIGIHYGRVIAGVIGYHKPQFSLIGDAVNTTSRVCTAKNPGQIRMSDEAYQQMMQSGGAGRNELYFLPKVEEMKGKGDVKVHIVARRAESSRWQGIGQALMNSKKKGLLPSKGQLSGVLSGGLSTDNFNFKPNNYINVLQNFREMLVFKRGDDNKMALRSSIQGTPSSSFIRTMKDEGEDFQEYDDNDDKGLVLLKPNKYLLTLSSYAKQKVFEFEESLLSKKIMFQRGSMLGLFFIYLLQTVFMLIIQDQFDASVAVIVLRVSFLIIIALFSTFWQMFARKGLRKRAILVIFTYGILVSILQANWGHYVSFHRIQLIEVMLLFLVATHSNTLDFITSIVMSICILICYFFIFGIKGILDIENVFFMIISLWANLVHVFQFFRMNIKFYNNLQIREKRKLEQSGLVSQLLPIHAAEKYFSDPTGKVDVSDEFEDVTILYADIKGFTDYSAGVEAKDVVTMLSALFTRFDKVCHKYSLYKVYTIGDCYVVISFVNASNRDPGKEANSMVKMAMSMIEIIREVRKEVKFEELDMRIGIHTGNIIGGIVGTDIVRYDIWGQDVLIANAMESEGVKGNINVSEATKNLLERTHRGLYRFEPHKVVDMEKIGSKIPCYLLYSNQNYEEY